MKNLEDLYRFFQRAIEREKVWENKYKAFSSRLEKKLTIISISYLPAIENKHRAIREIAKMYTREVWENFSFAHDPNTRKNDRPTHSKFKNPQTKEEALLNLRLELKNYPSYYHDSAIIYFWEDFEQQSKHERFLNDIFQEMKRSFSLSYANDLLQLETFKIVQFERLLYHYLAYRFVNEMYELE